MDFNHYFTNQELKDILNEWTHSYSKLASLSSIGDSYQKRPIWLLTITNQSTGPDNEKPAVWIDANIHATEISGTTTSLHIAHTLLTGYGYDEQITRLLNKFVYYIVPRVNPDGAKMAMDEKPRYIRSGVRPYPWEEKESGLHTQDIDEDGRILQMRILDPNGDWKISSLDPRLLEKRSPNENGGVYYRLFSEGLVEDYDGFKVEVARPLEGLDFNRNFPFEWRTEGDQGGAGTYPVSEPEIRSIVEFITDHPNINLAITYHTFSRVILRSYSNKADDAMETEDLWVMKNIGQIGSQITGYPCVSTFHDFNYHPKKVTTGAFDDWMYDHLGVFAYTIELWDIADEAGIKDRKFIEWHRDHPHEQDLQILTWSDENAGEDAYVPWYQFVHPQLGKVELGGWNLMYTWINPPIPLIAAEAQRNTPFALAMAEMLPRLEIQSLTVKALGQDDYYINLVVDNTGFLPTFTSKQGKGNKSVRPVRVELDCPSGVKFINGKRKLELGHLEGRSNKLDVTAAWGESSMDNRARAQWVVHAQPGTKIGLHVLSERAGAIHQTIDLI